MEKRKFNDGEKVKYQGREYTIKEAHYMFYPNGSWWEYYLDDGEKIACVGENLLEGIVVPQEVEKPVRTKEKSKKRKGKK